MSTDRPTIERAAADGGEEGSRHHRQITSRAALTAGITVTLASVSPIVIGAATVLYGWRNWPFIAAAGLCVLTWQAALQHFHNAQQTARMHEMWADLRREIRDAHRKSDLTRIADAVLSEDERSGLAAVRSINSRAR